MKPVSPGRFAGGVSVASRLTLVALVVTLISLAVTAVVGLQRGGALADDLMHDRLVTVNALHARDVRNYLDEIVGSVADLAASPRASDSIVQFRDAVEELRGEPPTSDDIDLLTQHYQNAVIPRLEELHGTSIGFADMLPENDEVIRLQSLYTVPKSLDGEGGEPVDPTLIDDAGDGSTYSRVHSELHPSYVEAGLQAGFDDLFLIDADTETVVYSLNKRIDFASSLETGPLSGSALSLLVNSIEEAPREQPVRIVDFAPYRPALDRPTMFAASPVFNDEGVLLGYLAAAISIDDVNAMMSGDGNSSHIGETGETYLAGSDGTTRSEPRPYSEAADTYLTDAADEQTGFLTQRQRAMIEGTGTTALVQPVNAAVVQAAMEGSGSMRTTNYRDVEVASVYRSVEVAGLRWAVITEMSVAELDAPVRSYSRSMLLIIATFVVVVTLVALRWSKGIVAPIRAVADRLRAVRAGREVAGDRQPVSGIDVAASSPREYLELAASIDTMLDRLDERSAAVRARRNERLEIQRRFLPPNAARRAEKGDGLLDHVPNATVTVIVVRGLDAALQRNGGSLRDVLGKLVDETDGLATDVGIDRAKVTGDSYVGICGASRPYLDHAPRSVGFALAARDLIAEIADENGIHLASSVGVASGAVSIGLTGSSGLVYDTWGPAVSHAESLARAASKGEVVVSPRVRAQLPSHFLLDGDTDGPATVVGRVEQEVST